MPHSAWAEAYRAVRTNIDFLRRNTRLQVLLVTSAYADEGKTTAASNLAISFAAAGRKVLLIDADLRHPSLDPIHGVDRVQGLSCLLNDVMPLHRVVQQSRINSLDVVTAGPEVPNPAELLSSPRLAELLDEARKSYDIILVDSSPLLAVSRSGDHRGGRRRHHPDRPSLDARSPRRRAIRGAAPEPRDAYPRFTRQRHQPSRARLQSSIPLRWAPIRPRFGIERGRGSHSGDPGPVAAPAEWSTEIRLGR